MYKLSDKIIKLIRKATENWKVELIVEGETLADVRV